MNTQEYINLHPEKNFTVTINDINNNRALLANVLYKKMEDFTKSVISYHIEGNPPTPQSFKLNILKNAYLNDKLVIKTQIKKLNGFEIHLAVVVKKKKVKNNQIICKAIFSYPLNEAIPIAS